MKTLTELNIKEVIEDDEIAIYCPTKELQREFLTTIAKKYCIFTCKNIEVYFRSDGICFYSDGAYSRLSYANRVGYPVYEFKGSKYFYFNNLFTLQAYKDIENNEERKEVVL